MTVSLLATDGYKLSMAEAGWPLRRETFYLCHRLGGLQVLPFDPIAELRALLPFPAFEDFGFLDRYGYEMGAGFKAAVAAGDALELQGLPRFSVFHQREPVLAVTGPSALVSWLEPLVLHWSWRIQVATLAVLEPEALPAAVATVTCEAQRELTLRTLDAVGVRAPPIAVDSDGYVRRVRAAAEALVRVVGDADRIFEVGLRAATCVEQHLLALEGCRLAGVRRTSHVLGAKRLGLVPVGTMGHEHVQRYGGDEVAFRAMVERRPQRSSFLLDTYDTLRSGLPAAFKLLVERPREGDSIRYDSGDKEVQLREAVRLGRETGVQPVHILEDGFDEPQTRRFEALRLELGLPPDRVVYGFGGHLVARPSGSPLTRDRVGAVYKLSSTGGRATMKFGDEASAGQAGALGGKQSLPGRPVLFRRLEGQGAFGLAGQAGEAPPPGYATLTNASERPLAVGLAEARQVPAAQLAMGVSPATRALLEALRATRPV
jgi:nicotinate phosphoribosyltransferase